MQNSTKDTNKVSFTLERAEEDDEFEEFERDGGNCVISIITRLEHNWSKSFWFNSLGRQLGYDKQEWRLLYSTSFWIW